MIQWPTIPSRWGATYAERKATRYPVPTMQKGHPGMKRITAFFLGMIGMASILVGFLGFIGVAMVILGYAHMIAGTSIFLPVGVSAIFILIGWACFRTAWDMEAS